MRVVEMPTHYELYYYSQYLGRFDKDINGIGEMVKLAQERSLQLDGGWWV